MLSYYSSAILVSCSSLRIMRPNLFDIRSSILGHLVFSLIVLGSLFKPLEVALDVVVSRPASLIRFVYSFDGI